jgi:hypothetical protein
MTFASAFMNPLKGAALHEAHCHGLQRKRRTPERLRVAIRKALLERAAASE